MLNPVQKIRRGDKIARIRIIPNMVSLNAAESRVARAKLSLDNAQTDYNRYQELYSKKVVPNSDFQKYELAWRNAKEELKDAQNNTLDLIKEGQTRAAGQATNTIVTSTIGNDSGCSGGG